MGMFTPKSAYKMPDGTIVYLDPDEVKKVESAVKGKLVRAPNGPTQGLVESTNAADAQRSAGFSRNYEAAAKTNTEKWINPANQQEVDIPKMTADQNREILTKSGWRPKYSAAEAMGRGFLGNSLFNWGEEVLAGGAALPPVSPVSGMPIPIPGGAKRGDENAIRQDFERKRQESAKDHPFAAAVGGAGGATVGSPLPVAPGAGSFLGTAAKLTGLGVGASALSGAGAAQPGHRLEGAIDSAKAGALPSAALGLVGARFSQNLPKTSDPLDAELGSTFDPLKLRDPRYLENAGGLSRAASLRASPGDLYKIAAKEGISNVGDDPTTAIIGFGRRLNNMTPVDPAPPSGPLQQWWTKGKPQPLLGKDTAPKVERALMDEGKSAGEVISGAEASATRRGAKVDLAEYLPKVDNIAKAADANRAKKELLAPGIVDTVKRTVVPPPGQRNFFPPKVKQEVTGAEWVPATAEGSAVPTPKFEKVQTDKIIGADWRPTPPLSGPTSTQVGIETQGKFGQQAPVAEWGTKDVPTPMTPTPIYETKDMLAGADWSPSTRQTMVPKPILESRPAPREEQFVSPNWMAESGRMLREEAKNQGKEVMGASVNRYGQSTADALDKSAGVAMGMTKDATAGALDPLEKAAYLHAKDNSATAATATEAMNSMRQNTQAPYGLGAEAQGIIGQQFGEQLGLPAAGQVGMARLFRMFSRQRNVYPNRATRYSRLAAGMEGEGPNRGWDLAGSAVNNVDQVPLTAQKGFAVTGADDVVDPNEDPFLLSVRRLIAQRMKK